jgi:hypothetical protein
MQVIKLITNQEKRETQMRKSILLISLLVMALMLVACDTGDTSTQTTSAQSLQPNLTGFSVQDGSNIVETFANTVAAGSAATGNIPLAATLERVGTTLECLTDVGAVSAQVYRQTANVSIVPQAGVSLVVNQDRVERNILGCVTDLPFGAQSLSIEPCAETGTFTFQNEKFYYAYIGAGTELCSAFDAHFNTYNPTVQSSTQ